MAERRGGFRHNPQASNVLPAIEEALRRKNASFLRGVFIPSNGLYENVTGDAGPWRYVGTSGEPSFLNGWVNYGGAWRDVAFFKDALGIVHVKGLVKSGTIGQDVFTLPGGYRPKQGMHLPTASNAAFGMIQVLSSGAVRAANGSNTYFSLEFSFPAEQ